MIAEDSDFLTGKPPEEKRPDPIPDLIVYKVDASVNKDGLLIGLIQFKVTLKDALDIYIRVCPDSKGEKRKLYITTNPTEADSRYYGSVFDSLTSLHQRANERATYIDFYGPDMRKAVTAVFGEDLS
jgi:hypothetical protein